MSVNELDLEVLSQEVLKMVDEINKVENDVTIHLSLHAKEDTPQDNFRCIRISTTLENIIYHRINDAKRITAIFKFFGSLPSSSRSYYYDFSYILRDYEKEKQEQEMEKN